MGMIMQNEKMFGGTSDYGNLNNKPKINNVELSGNKTTSELGIPTNAEQLPIESGSATNTKSYIDSGLSGKADTSDIPTVTEITPVRYTTNVSSSGYAVSCFKYGRVVVLSVTLSTERSIGNDDILLSGLPIPQVDTIRASLGNGNSKAVVRTKITTSGYLSIHYDTIGTGEIIFGVITYISAT